MEDNKYEGYINNKIKVNKYNQQESDSPCIIIQGGTNFYSDYILIEKLSACKQAACNGYKILIKNQNAVEAVEVALWWLECDEFFNCGYGSALNLNGNVQMDACIADGRLFQFGSVAAISKVEHPISFAKYILENHPNNIIIGDNAKELANNLNVGIVAKENMISPAAALAYDHEYFNASKEKISAKNVHFAKELRNGLGMVGCIAWDGYTMAAGTTFGGLNKKIPDVIGDAALFGHGIFVNENIACSLTMCGEAIMKSETAKSIVECIEKGHCPQDILKSKLSDMAEEFNVYGGGIALHKSGCWGSYFTNTKMPYAIIKNDRIIFGTNLEEKKSDTYIDSNKDLSCGCKNLNDRFDSKVFNIYEQ